MQQNHAREAKEGEKNSSPRLRGMEVGFLVFLAISTLAIIAIVAARAWNIGLAEWSWKYYETSPGPLSLLLLAVPAIVCIVPLVLGVMFCLRRRVRTGGEEAVAVGFVLLVCLLGVVYVGDSSPLGDGEAVMVTTKSSVSGYFTESVLIENLDIPIGEYLQDYAKRIDRLSVNDKLLGHLADHPVGPILCHVLISRLLDSWPWLAQRFTASGIEQDALLRMKALQNTAEVLPARDRTNVRLSQGMYAGIWASAFLFRFGYWLALIPVYFLARDLYSREVGLVAVALSALIPSLHLFGPYPDQIFPLIAVGTFYAWVKAVRRRSMVWSALSAVLMLFGLQWSLSLLVAGAVMCVASCLMAWQEFLENGRNFDWVAWLRLIMLWIGTFVVLSLLPMVLFGYDVWGVWKVCLSKHATFAARFNRSYWPWVLFNPVDFGIFAGVPVCLLMVYGAVQDAGRWWKERRRRVLFLLPWSLLCVLFVLDFSGKTLGEAARVWMFLMPFAAVSAAAVLTDLDRRRGWIAAGVTALLAAQLLVFRLNLNVMFVFE